MKIDPIKFKMARENAGVSRSDIAKVAGVSVQRIWQVETESISRMNPVLVGLIAKKLNINIKELEG